MVTVTLYSKKEIVHLIIIKQCQYMWVLLGGGG